jgi:3-hexulose-6-phosphate synthase
MALKTVPLLQLAFDMLTVSEALEVVEAVHPFFDIGEIGTPLIIEEGLSALEVVKKKHPEKEYLADLKIMDAGYVEASSAFRRGADIVTVLAAADDRTIEEALRASTEYGRKIMADLINVPAPACRAKELEKMGVPILCVHTAFDRQSCHADPMADLEDVRAVVSCKLALAGGLDVDTVSTAIDVGTDIVVVGGAVLRQEDRRKAASDLYSVIRKQ